MPKSINLPYSIEIWDSNTDTRVFLADGEWRDDQLRLAIALLGRLVPACRIARPGSCQKRWQPAGLSYRRWPMNIIRNWNRFTKLM